tara:strand:+ start:44 stop:1264 length:1221 start_codon:yes stop_codon:yes gene_type:complete
LNNNLFNNIYKYVDQNVYQNRVLYLLKKNIGNIPLLDRWIFFELIPPLLFSIAALSTVSLSLGVMFDLIRKIVESGLPFFTAIYVLLLRLPGFLVISFPMAMLMASLLVFSRMSANSEIKALRSVGVSSKRIVFSAIIMGILMSFLTFFFNDFVVPKSNRSADIILRKGLQSAMHSDYGENIIYSKFGKIYNPKTSSYSDGLTHLFFAKEFQNSTMNEVILLDLSRLGYNQTLVAKNAYWIESQAKWEFRNGKIITISPNNSSTSVGFDSYTYPMDAGLDNFNDYLDNANNLTVLEAKQARIAFNKAGNFKEERKMKVRIQEKFTLPMACVVFGLIGSSLGSRSDSRSGKGQGFGLSIILILFYYIVSFSFSSLGVMGILNPSISAWSPVFISLIVGCLLLDRADK